MPLWQHVMVGTRLLRPVRRRRAATDGPSRSTRSWCGWRASRTAATARRRPAAAAGGGRAAARGAARPSRAEVIERLDARGPAAGDHVHLQPGRLRRRGRAVPARRAAADHAATSATEIRADRRGALRATSRTRTSPSSATTSGSTASSAASPRTTPACCRPSRRSSRSCSSAAWSRPCSPPRRWRSGINMPARSVVLEKLVKWNGETHADVTPGEYTQLTGRAGRRGIDVEGHAVVRLAARARPARGRRARVHPHLPAALAASGRRTTWRSTWSARSAGERARDAARVVVRAVPGRPGGRRAGPAGAHATRRRSTATARR